MTNSKRTQLLLQALARRLSGREDCKQIQFQIGIGTLIPDDNPVRFLIPEAVAKNYIFFQPDLFVYRDMHHRKDIDKFRPADLVILKYFPELNLGPDDQGNLKIDTSKLNRGVYQYQLSRDGKRRRWVKVNKG